MARLAGKVAYITGAGTGIGRCTAELFAREGALVTIADIDKTAGEEVAHGIVQAGGEAIALHTDVCDPVGFEASMHQAEAHWGRLDVLHNNAGGSTLDDANAVEAPIDEFWRAITLDLFGTFLGCRFGIPALIRAGGGAVINMSSVVALMGFPGRDCYTAAKGGVTALTRSLAVEFAAQKVRVNAIAPCVTLTPRVERLMAGNAAVRQIAEAHLLGLGQPIDMAQAALYLASDDSRIVTGQILTVDSGITTV